ncbi:TerB family tellurite resistance protein [Nitratireductor sp. B36]|uniref:TerB family tellurite resistance protein n=1 Tax=Nitratireductor sp. B36 TaxID=2762059 RepID=UPI001E6192F7|nr:TerB family tellurite resistance protein [Nitratireductor sp. B36]MCC5777693.1 TerB family tellurite resistance protein [Nitratireductor sp. B36]
MPASPEAISPARGRAMTAAMNAVSAEVLLLLRLALTDEAIGPREADVLRRFAASVLKFSDDEVAEIMSALEDLALEVDIMQARANFRQMSHERRLILAETLFELAMRDAELGCRAERLTTRVCDVLALGAEDVAHLSG